MDTRVKPLPPVDDHDDVSDDRDHAKNGYSLRALENLVDQCNNQPSDWRWRADRAHAYYDIGKQLTPEKEHKIRVLWGIDPVQTNLIHGVINGVLGQEARQRSDVLIEADDDDFQDTADVLSKGMKEAQRESNSDMAVSNGYAGQVKGGIGWVEVSNSQDPLDYFIRVQDVDRREIWFDWQSRDLGLRDARWLIRKRWYDLDEACAWMPEHRKILKNAVNGWDLTVLPDDTSHPMYRSYQNERTTTIQRDEWLDSTRKRIKLFEVWYRVPAWVPVLITGGKKVQFDESNPVHQMAVQRGIVKIERAVTMQVRMAIFAGPHRMLDVGTNRRSFPYIPFFGFRDDADRSPYGLIEGMISPQDEYNDRRQMVNWMLKARQVKVDSDALDPDYNNIRDLAKEAMRPDFMAVMNPSRMNKAGALEITNNLQLQSEQIQVMQDAKQLIQEVPRIYSTQLGNAPTGVTSGIAINSLTEAGAVAMGELNDNYRFGRKRVHEEMLDRVIDSMSTENLRVTMGSGQSKRVIVLNTWDPQGMPVNRVKDAPIKVGLADIPSSPAFRMQEQQQLATIIQALGGNPQALAVLAPAYIEGSSLANRQVLANALRRATGQPVDGDQKQQQAAQQAQMQAQQLAQAKEQAEVEEKTTRALVNKTTAALNVAKAKQMQTDATLSVIQAQQEPANDEDAQIDAAINEARTAR